MRTRAALEALELDWKLQTHVSKLIKHSARSAHPKTSQSLFSKIKTLQVNHTIFFTLLFYPFFFKVALVGRNEKS